MGSSEQAEAQARSALEDQLDELLSRHPLVLIGGYPRTGKTTLGCSMRIRQHVTISSDDYISVGWDNVPKALVKAVERAKREHPALPVVIEGVRALSVLREGVRAGAVMWLTKAKVRWTDGQRSMIKGRATNFAKTKKDGLLDGVELVLEAQEIGR